MAYTVEITDGSSTYTFGVAAMPNWSVASIADYDTTKYPAVLIKQTDTLTLADCSYRNATASSVTTDWATLRTLLFDRLTPITSVKLKDGANTIEQMTTSTHDQLMVVGMTPNAGAGFYANHWLGSITVKGVALKGDASSVVRKTRSYSYSWDQHGFETRSLNVKIETLPGVSASGKMASEAISLPSAKWTYTTNSDDGINYVIEEDTEDTVATGVSTIVEQALTIPANVNEYNIKVSTKDGGDTKETVTTITVQADTLARAKSIAKGGAAPSGYTKRTIVEDKGRNKVVATYVQRDEEKLDRVKAWSLKASGGGREREAIRFPSTGASGPRRRPLQFIRPSDVYVFDERVVVEKRGDPVPKVPSLFATTEDLETHVSTDLVTRVERGSVPSENIYRRTVVRKHRFFGDPPSPVDLLRGLGLGLEPNKKTDFAVDIAERNR